MECANCGSNDFSHGGEWLGEPVCWRCNRQGFHLANVQRERAEKAEAELATLRPLCVQFHMDEYGEWEAHAPDGRVLVRLNDGLGWSAYVAAAHGFATKAEASEAAGGLPWWEVQL